MANRSENARPCSPVLESTMRSENYVAGNNSSSMYLINNLDGNV